MDPVDDHSSDDPCPRCGGRVELTLRSGVGIDGHLTDWGESGTCSGCGVGLGRPIGPADLPVIAMRPLGPWREERADE